MSKDDLIIQIFGEENLNYFSNQIKILDIKDIKLQELNDIRHRASRLFL